MSEMPPKVPEQSRYIPLHRLEMWRDLIRTSGLSPEDQHIFLEPLVNLHERATPRDVISAWVNGIATKNPDISKKDDELKKAAQLNIKPSTELNDTDEMILNLFRELREDASDLEREILKSRNY